MAILFAQQEVAHGTSYDGRNVKGALNSNTLCGGLDLSLLINFASLSFVKGSS